MWLFFWVSDWKVGNCKNQARFSTWMAIGTKTPYFVQSLYIKFHSRVSLYWAQIYNYVAFNWARFLKAPLWSYKIFSETLCTCPAHGQHTCTAVYQGNGLERNLSFDDCIPHCPTFAHNYDGIYSSWQSTLATMLVINGRQSYNHLIIGFSLHRLCATPSVYWIHNSKLFVYYLFYFTHVSA
jgi:hypothetical protein